MSNEALALIGTIAAWALSLILSILILWAIIRGAVLSALRKHAEEQRNVK